MRKDDIRIIAGTAIGLWILLILFTTSDANAKSLNCNNHPIYCQIKSNNPKMKNDEAFKLSNIIYKVSKKHHIPTRIFVAILMQESRYSLEARGCHKGLVKTITYPKKNTNILMTVHPPKIEYTETKVCADFGIGQIWYKTANRYKFDLPKLTTDLEYSVEAAAIVLSDFQSRYSAREVDWWTRYNASSKIKRKIYKQLVERYF